MAGGPAVSGLVAAVILGALQGATEFLPISSSGHLALLQHFLPVEGDSLAFDLVLHLGTLVPVLVMFRHDLIRMLQDPLRGEGPLWSRPGTRWLVYVVIASVPTAVMGLLLEDLFVSMFSGFWSLSWQFVITALILHGTARWGGGQREIDEMTWKDALLIGIAQGFSVLPAVSRSGATIAAGMALGLRRDLAGRFSFVCSVPAILGAVLLKLDDVTLDPAQAPSWAAGAVVSLVVGWASLVLLMKVVRAGDFSKFAAYCWVVAAACAALAASGA